MTIHSDHNSFVVSGELDEHGKFTGSNIAFVYTDLSTALVGTFKAAVSAFKLLIIEST